MNEPIIHTIDLQHLGLPGRIASYLIDAPAGPILIETGPSSCHRALVEGLARHGFAPDDVEHIFVTHIHLDHAGAAGWWAARGATIYVHEIGAPHLIDPSKLAASAARLYGDRMEKLWGDIPPTASDRVRTLTDSETVVAAGLEIEALATPGHAFHHHVYRVGTSAFTGDLAAIVTPENRLVEIPTPPPEYDLELWHQSIERVRALKLSTIYPTHFGQVDTVDQHLDCVHQLLSEGTDLVHQKLLDGQSRRQIDSAFSDWTSDRLRQAGASAEQLREITNFNPPSLSLAGILRYWKKRSGLVPAQAP
jgi:glyoxylase-like metal-dependent hydrolase (beta-lactamase superfamily II)